MITEMWGENNWMIDQIRLNIMTCYLWASQDRALMFKVHDKYWGSEFFVTFNSEGKIYDINDKF